MRRQLPALLFAAVLAAPAGAVEYLTIRTCAAEKLLHLVASSDFHPLILEIEMDHFVAPLTFPRSLGPQKSFRKALKKPITVKAIRAILDEVVMGKTIGVYTFPNMHLDVLMREGVRYTYVIRDKHFAFAETGSSLLKDNLSKHLILSRGKRVRYAGEMWLENGVLHVNNASGSFEPPAQDLPLVKSFFWHAFRKDVVTHAHVPE